MQISIQFIDYVVSTLTEPVDRDFASSFVTDTSTDELSSSTIDRLVDELVKVPVVAWEEMFTSLLDYDDSSELWQLSMPALMVWGDLDPLVTRAMQETLKRRVYEGAGHTPRWEQPERFAADVASFTHALS